MVEQSLAPGVKHGGDADLRVKIVAPELQQRGRRRVEQQGVKPGAVLLDQRIEFMRQREHQMEIGNGQERFGLFVQPVKPIGPLAGGAMAVAAGVRDKMFLAAMAATIMMSAQGGRAAGHDGAQDFPMVERARRCSRVYRGIPARNTSAKVNPGVAAASTARRLHAAGDQAFRAEGRKLDQVQRAFQQRQTLLPYMQIFGGGGQVAVSQ